jgi:hypothetical protein
MRGAYKFVRKQGKKEKVSDHPCIEDDSHINSSMSQTCSRRASQLAISPMNRYS